MPRGRPMGALNKATRDIREAAREYTDDALKTLARLMKSGKTEQARVAAAKELLDRGYGKSTAHIEANINLLERLSPDEQQALAAALEALARDEGEDASGTARTTH